MAEATVGSLTEAERAAFEAALGSKSAKLLSLVKDREELGEGDFREFFGIFLSSRRHHAAVMAANGGGDIAAAIKSLRVSRMEPAIAIRRFTSLSGAPAAVLEDVAFEAIHFLNPDIYGLCTRWVFNPGTGKGALSAAVRGNVDGTWDSRQALLREAKSALDAAGYGSDSFYPLDIACSLAYASGIMGAKDSSMNSGGMEALFPNSTVLAAMILGIRREIIAHT